MRKAALAGLFLILCGCRVVGPVPTPDPVPTPVPQPTPNVVVDEPSAEMKQLVSAIEPISEPRLANFYADFAEIVERDSEIIKTTGHFRTLNSRAGQLAFKGTDLQGKYPTLGADLDAAALKVLGKENTTLDRPKVVEFLKAVSWAAR